MIRISILGTGNVARHLCHAFKAIDTVKIVQVVGRNEKALKTFGSLIDTTSDFTKILEADIYIIAVKDDAVLEVSEHLKGKRGLVVHTSGSVSLDALSPHERHGVFYPLQTFSQDRKVDMKSVPFCLEAHDEPDLGLLEQLSFKISSKVYIVDTDQRLALHLAAVFVNNFTNHLYHIGKEICDKKQLPFEILYPLIRETTAKVGSLSPNDAQTGPARRGDVETMERHMRQLEHSRYEGVYKILSGSIENLYR